MFCSEPHEEICLKVALKFVFDPLGFCFLVFFGSKARGF